MNTLQICPPHLSTCSHFTLGNPSYFSTLLFIYFRLFTLPQKKTNSNHCNAALAVYLLFSASCYLHSPSTASAARYRRSACIDMDMLRLAACCDTGEFQHSVVYYATDQCRRECECSFRPRGRRPVSHLLWSALFALTLTAVAHDWRPWRHRPTMATPTAYSFYFYPRAPCRDRS